MLEAPVTEDEARQAGWELDDYSQETLYVWPENERAWRLFARVYRRWHLAPLSTQRIGLRWAEVYPLIDRAAPRRADWCELAQQLEVMETAALDAQWQPFE